MICISVRPGRASHTLIEQQGDFAINIPTPDMEFVSDFVGTKTMRQTDKWKETGLTRISAVEIKSPLLEECPVNIECRVTQQIKLPSHSLFIGEVLAVHALPEMLNIRNEVDFYLARGGLVYLGDIFID